MYVHPKLRVAYLAHPRTASQATAWALMQQVEFVKVLPDGDRVREVQGQHHDGPPAELAERVQREGWTVLTTVRNHYDALVSWWYYRNRPQGLDRFVRELPWMHTGYFPEPREMWALHSGLATRVLRYERLQRDLTRALERVALGPVHVPTVNVSEERTRRAYRPYYDEATRRWVRHWWGEEMEELGYEW